jgi:hypothetical protein
MVKKKPFYSKKNIIFAKILFIMKTYNFSNQVISVFVICIMLLTGCVSSTLIQSNPSGAKVYVNGALAGTTPYKYKDSKIVGTKTSIRLEKEGYKPLSTYIKRNEQADVGAIIGGIFLFAPLFLWTMKYDDVHLYEMEIIRAEQQSVKQGEMENTQNKVSALLDLKLLLDEGIITAEEFEAEKAKILNAK